MALVKIWRRALSVTQREVPGAALFFEKTLLTEMLERLRSAKAFTSLYKTRLMGDI